MSKYWPIVFWMYDVSGSKVLKYKPSSIHRNDVRWCFLETDALAYGLRRLSEDGSNGINIQAMPSFIVKVIKSKTKPDISDDSTLRLFVERIPLNDVTVDGVQPPDLLSRVTQET